MIINHDIIIMVFMYISLDYGSFIAGIGFGCVIVWPKSRVNTGPLLNAVKYH